MSIRFYCGINEKVWNYHPVSPGDYACVVPVIGAKEGKRKENRVHVPNGVKVIQDSGAFCDSNNERLSFSDAYIRQVTHAEKHRYADNITHRASYDLLIDEKWIDGRRIKSRWNEKDAWKATYETINAGKYLYDIEKDYRLVLSGQGVSVEQYILCAKELAPLLNDKDIFGLGGWCILGIKKNILRDSFRAIMKSVIPYLSVMKVKNVHIWGSLYAPAIGELLWLCDKYGLNLSTDSAGPQMRPCFGSWGYADWTNKTYCRPETDIRGQERARHVLDVIRWLKNFRETKYYKSPYTNEKWRI